MRLFKVANFKVLMQKSSNYKIIVGVDEAGRGPILGPLVMAALAFKEEDLKKLEWLGVKDSKQLTLQTREELFGRIREIVHDFRIEVIEPDAIDLSIFDPDTNLNWLEAETAARMVSELLGDVVIIDCPSPNLSAYEKFFRAKMSEAAAAKAQLVVEHKADVNYIACSAASVVAKVLRDRAIENIKNEIKIDFGSGYLSDPKTKEFLDSYFDKYPHLFRKSWTPYKQLEEKKKQKTLGDF